MDKLVGEDGDESVGMLVSEADTVLEADVVLGLVAALIMLELLMIAEASVVIEPESVREDIDVLVVGRAVLVLNGVGLV